jgi:hypothetical protein
MLFDEEAIVMAVHLPFDMSSIPHKDDDPLLRRYDTISDIVLMKHVNWATGYGVTVAPGFDNSYSWGDPQVPLPRGADLFKKRLKIALRHLDPRLPILKIDTWNDWGGWSYFEPTVKKEFAYLEALKSPLEGYIESRYG